MCLVHVIVMRSGAAAEEREPRDDDKEWVGGSLVL